MAAFHLSWQFPVPSLLLSCWGGQMAEGGTQRGLAPAAGAASLQSGGKDWEHLPGAGELLGSEIKQITRICLSGKEQPEAEHQCSQHSRKSVWDAEMGFLGKW